MKRISCFPVVVIAILLLSLWLIVPQEAVATIVITQGTLVISEDIGHVSISSETRGFSMDGRGDSAGGICDLCFKLVHPGDPLRLTAWWSGMDLDGSFTIDGTTYLMGAAAWGYPPFLGDGWVELEGSTTAPPMTENGTATIVAPFSLSDRSHVSWLPNGPLPPILTEPLTGGGLVTIPLVESPFAPTPTWQINSAVYVFTPEPGTLLLLGSGLVGLGGVAWMRHRRR